MSDVRRLRAGLDRLVQADDRQGGDATLESDALARAGRALGLQDNSASQRVRTSLFGMAAEYTALAAWYCVDTRDFGRAQLHLDRAMTLAGLAQDGTVQFQVWNSQSILAHQLNRLPESLTAAQVGLSLTLCRRDPFFASLAHARTAVGHAALGDRQAALRSVGRAQEALPKTAEAPRPGWADFYGPAELMSLTSVVQNRLGMFAQAEASSYRALAALPERFRRNRGLATAQLALSQVGQGEVELACVTAADVFAIMGEAPLPARMRTLLGDFHRKLVAAAPASAEAREWSDRLRTNWS
jgi:hypothetical protein